MSLSKTLSHKASVSVSKEEDTLKPCGRQLTEGAFLKPFTAWKIPPPIAPMVKAPPQSSTILQGLEVKYINIKILSDLNLHPNSFYQT